MREDKFKSMIFWLLFAGKIFLFVFILIKSAVGGLTKQETTVAITVIMPLFATNIGLILKNLFRRPFEEKQKSEAKVSKNLRNITIAVILLYIIAFYFVIQLSAHGNVNPDDFPKYLTGIESSLGVYLGIIIQSVFKVEES